MDRRIARPKWRRWLPFAVGGGALLAAVIAYLILSPGGARRVEASEITLTEVRQAPFQDFVPVRGVVLNHATRAQAEAPGLRETGRGG